MNKNYLFLLVISFGLFACSDDTKTQKGVFDTQVKSYNKAKKVEDQLLQRDQQQRKKIDEATR
jgi:hypothetical protein